MLPQPYCTFALIIIYPFDSCSVIIFVSINTILNYNEESGTKTWGINILVDQ